MESSWKKIVCVCVRGGGGGGGRGGGGGSQTKFFNIYEILKS